ncbi:MAG: hypothetical protein ABI602_03975 [Candidatus Saccharibacteria bacterium]
MAEQNTSDQSSLDGQTPPSVAPAPTNPSPNEPDPASPPASVPAPAPHQQLASPNEPQLSEAAPAESPWHPTNPPTAASTINWTASEYIAHHKSLGWYTALGLGGIAGAFGLWLFTKDLISPGVVLFGAIILGAYGGRQPRQQQFQLDKSGLTIGSKYYPYDSFRSFSVIAEGAFSSIMFMPLKRFASTVSIYYAPPDEEAIIALLGERLPSEDHAHDLIDRFMDRIRF